MKKRIRNTLLTICLLGITCSNHQKPNQTHQTTKPLTIANNQRKQATIITTNQIKNQNYQKNYQIIRNHIQNFVKEYLNEITLEYPFIPYFYNLKKLEQQALELQYSALNFEENKDNEAPEIIKWKITRRNFFKRIITYGNGETFEELVKSSYSQEEYKSYLTKQEQANLALRNSQNTLVKKCGEIIDDCYEKTLDRIFYSQSNN